MERQRERVDNGRLVQEVMAGNRAAFDLLWRSYRDLLWRIASRMLKDESSAKDILQESCLRAYIGIRSLRDPRLLRSWLIGILINVYREWTRDHDNRSSSFDSMAELTGGYQFFESRSLAPAFQDPAAIFENKELKKVLSASVMLLPVGLRRSALLFYFDGLSVKEAAAMLGVSPQALKMRLSRARTLLRRRLAMVGGTNNGRTGWYA